MLNKLNKNKVKRYFLGMMFFLICYSFLMLLYIYPHWPIDFIGWILLVVVGIPAYLCLEFISTWFFCSKRGHKVSTGNFSFKRIIIGTVFVLVAIIAFGFLFYVLTPIVAPHFR
jgi:hypothetical protein